MDIDRKIELIKLPPTEEIVTENELRELLESQKHAVAYDGFEPSGLMHLGTGLVRTIKTNDFVEAGVTFILYIADWFAYLNRKLGGDIDLIRKAGEYFIEGWKAAGMKMDGVKIVWASDLIKREGYWETFLQISRSTTMKRVLRATTITGRKESEVREPALLIYPLMQTTDIFMLNDGKGVDICQLGMDQRKVNMLAREIAEKLGKKKPIAIHHHLIAGLQAGKRMGKDQVELKMSKSKPETAIFIHDSREEIFDKIRKAYCPAKQVENNPLLDIAKNIIFRRFDRIEINRPEKYGGPTEALSYEELERMFVGGEIHPVDLKEAVAEKLDEIISPIRSHFEKGKARELYEIVKNARVTR